MDNLPQEGTYEYNHHHIEWNAVPELQFPIGEGFGWAFAIRYEERKQVTTFVVKCFMWQEHIRQQVREEAMKEIARKIDEKIIFSERWYYEWRIEGGLIQSTQKEISPGYFDSPLPRI